MITDPEVQLLAALAEGLKSEYKTKEDLSWSQSPFGWIKPEPPRRKGAIGEKLVAGWCAARDINVLRSPDAEADRVLEGFRTEIKFSLLWGDGKLYRFQQIRDQDYQLLVCLGVSPFTAHAWVFEKEFVVSNIGLVAGLSPQHGGAEGRDTAWLRVSPANVHPWMKPYGGDLSAALRRLRTLLGLP